LSGIYKTRGGEQWSDVARQVTGNDVDANTIQRANPGVSTPMEKGLTIQIPFDTKIESEGSSKGLSVRVDGKEIKILDDFVIAISLDAISKCNFAVPNVQKMRDIFKPQKDQRLQVLYDGEVLLTGRCASPSPNGETLLISGDSLPAVLETSSPSIKKYPLEWKQSKLETIAEDVCLEHGISVQFSSKTSANFKRVDYPIGGRVLGFLSNLASQRGMIITSTFDGKLLIHKGETIADNSTSFFQENKHPVIDIRLEISENNYYSSITGLMPKKSRRGSLGKHYTVQNPYKTYRICAETYEVKDIDEGELPKAVESKAGRMFGEFCSVKAEVSTWLNDIGTLLLPGQIVAVQSSQNFIDEPFNFLIRTVNLQKKSNSETATLDLCLPGVFSGEIPGRMPWE